MISLTIAGANGTATIPDTGSTGYVLVALSPGTRQRENTYAESRWQDGASLTSSRTDLLSMSAVVRVIGTSVANVMTQVDTLGSIVDAFGYTVTASYTGEGTAIGGSAVYTAMPASYSVEYDPDLMRNNQTLVSLSIPVQP